MPPAGGDEGFVLLEGKDTISTEMQAAAQGPADPAPVVEYELASFRRTLSNLSSSASIKEEDVGVDEDEEEEGEEELRGMPKDLKGICRFLRKQAAGGAATVETEEEQEERRRRRAARRLQQQQEQLKKGPRGIHGFLCFAWPIGTRELLFWVLLTVFMTTLVTLGGGRTRAGPRSSSDSPLSSSSSSSSSPLGTCPASTSPTPMYHHDVAPETTTSTAKPAARPRPTHPPTLSPYTELSLLRAQLRAENLLAHDREHELAWLRATQDELATEVDSLVRL